MSNDGGVKRYSRIAFTSLQLEALFVLALALFQISLGFTHDKEWGPFLGVVVMALMGSAGLAAIAYGIKNEKRWATSPAILANLIALGVAKYQFEAGLYWLAVPIVLVAISVVVSVFLIIKESGSSSSR